MDLTVITEHESLHRWLRLKQFAMLPSSSYGQNPLPVALTCFLADIPLRLAHCRENPYRLLTDGFANRNRTVVFGMKCSDN
jgi:hypothetical protein